MKWQIRIESFYDPRESLDEEILGEEAEPWLKFETLEELVRVLRGLGELTDRDAVRKYADRVESEGGIMERVAASMPGAGQGPLSGAMLQAVWHELPPVR